MVKVSANGAAIYDHYHELKIFLENQTLVNSRMGSYVINKDRISKLMLIIQIKNRKNLYKTLLTQSK